MKELDLSVIILTKNEEIHIGRALKNVCPVAKHVFVVDSLSDDRTAEICANFDNVYVVKHAWPGNQADQFNWALDNLGIKTEWVLRLDADEYLTQELISEIQNKLPVLQNDISAIVFPLRRVFHGKMLKHSTAKSVKMIRLFRLGCARYEQRLMDEHLHILKGRTVSFANPFVDDSLIDMTAFVDKHNGYSSREAAMLLDAEYGLTESNTAEVNIHFAEEVVEKRRQKKRYSKMPLYWRSIGYFLYRYILRLGFLDGRSGFEWDFFQGLWYRLLIDAKVSEAKRLCGDNKEKLRNYIRTNFKVNI